MRCGARPPLDLREQVGERHGVDEPLPRHVAVAAVARRRPREAVLDEMLAESVRCRREASSPRRRRSARSRARTARARHSTCRGSRCGTGRRRTCRRMPSRPAAPRTRRRRAAIPAAGHGTGVTPGFPSAVGMAPRSARRWRQPPQRSRAARRARAPSDSRRHHAKALRYGTREVLRPAALPTRPTGYRRRAGNANAVRFAPDGITTYCRPSIA